LTLQARPFLYRRFLHIQSLTWMAYVVILGCADRAPVSLCEAIALLDGSWDSTSMDDIFVGVGADDRGREVIVLSTPPPWRSFLSVTAEPPANRRNVGPKEWLEPYDTFELQMRLQQLSGRDVSAETARGVVRILAERAGFETSLRLVSRDCDVATYHKFDVWR
jgi:hypothetical protein